MSEQTRKSLKKRIINADEKEGVVKKMLTEFYQQEVTSDMRLRSYFHTDGTLFLGAGAFGQVFSITAKRNVSFGDLEAITVALTIEEKHDFLNKVEPMRYQNRGEIAIRKGSSVALKCETVFSFQLEHFPVRQKCLPDAHTDRFTLYKEFNTLTAVFNRYGYMETRGFTKPFAFGRLGDYTFLHFEGVKKTKLFGFHFLLMELCGPDLEDMLEVCSHNCRQNDQRLSTRTVFLLGDQFITRLQCLQEPSIGLCHNDLKCDQLMTGLGENTNTIYLIDYGLVTKYKDTWNSALTITPIGNRRWASRSNHQMAPRTPLCELESACYVLLRLLKNHFPWDGMFDKQVAKLQEMKDKGENDLAIKTGDQVLYEEKQFLWLFLKRRCTGGKMLRVADLDAEQEIEKYKDFFEERNDKWGDGGMQMFELMLGMAELGDPIFCGFTEKKIEYAEINYMHIRAHLLGIFDLSMYAHCVNSLTGAVHLQTQAFFHENRERTAQRTECGRPVYHYFPEGEQHCFWEWHCRCRDLWENRPEYWHKVLANRDELADLLRQRQASAKRVDLPESE